MVLIMHFWLTKKLSKSCHGAAALGQDQGIHNSKRLGRPKIILNIAAKPSKSARGPQILIVQGGGLWGILALTQEN